MISKWKEDKFMCSIHHTELEASNDFFFFFKENHCMFNLPFLSIGLLFAMTPLSPPPFPNESHVKSITGLTASSFYF